MMRFGSLGAEWPSRVAIGAVPAILAMSVSESSKWASALLLVVALLVVDSVDFRSPAEGFTSADGALVLAASMEVGVLVAVAAGLLARLVVSSVTGRGAHRQSPLSLAGFGLSVVMAGLVLTGLLKVWASVPSVLAVVCGVCVFYLVDTRLRIPRTVGIDSILARRAMETEIRRQFPILAAYVSAAGLFVLIHPSIGNWAYLPIVALLVVIRQSYALLANMQSTYLATLGVMVEACEADGPPEQLGRGERIRQLARAIGAEAGLPARDLDILSETALLESFYDSASFATESDSDAVSVSFSEVSFLAPCVNVLREFHGQVDSGDESPADIRMAAVLATATLLEDSRMGGTGRQSSKQYVVGLDPRVSTRVLGAAARLGHRVEL